MIHDRDWLALQSALGQGAMLKPLIDTLGGAKEIFALSEQEKRISGLFTAKQIKRLEQPDYKGVERTLQLCETNGWKIYTYQDSAYPAALREIPNPPAALFCRGEIPDFSDRLSVGVVGSREATRYALKATDYLAYVIARCNGIIVSGGALGVDSASHRAALRACGTTVAVLGCGFGTKYLMQFEAMRQEISTTGAVLTEYPPFTEISRSSFPLRNRLISGLSDGVVVVEAAMKSGSLITAKRAAEQGKDVFAVPGSIVSHAYMGTNQLLADGAMAALSPEIILSYYTNKYESIDLSKQLSLAQWQASAAVRPAVNLTKADRAENQSFELDQVDDEKVSVHTHCREVQNLSPALETIYNSLTEAYEHIDIIIDKTELDGSVVISALTQLELMGLVTTASGKRYRKDESGCLN